MQIEHCLKYRPLKIQWAIFQPFILKCAKIGIHFLAKFFKAKKTRQAEEKGINYKAQVLKRDIFNAALSKQAPNQIEKEESWFCFICNEDYQSAMVQCVKCNNWVHENCVALTEDDVEAFECPDCSPQQFLYHERYFKPSGRNFSKGQKYRPIAMFLKMVFFSC